jgi:thiol-disulfide isomerase/thioredoxin
MRDDRWPVETFSMRRSMRIAASILALLLAVAGTGAPLSGEPAETGVALRPIKYSELGKMIRGFKGKVVLVDFWAEYCTSCKKEFPHLVEMHRKYAKDGLVAVSVTLDDPSDLPVRARAVAFLKSQGAEFTNVLLDETPEYWQSILKIDGPPCIYIFNRDNRFVLKRDGAGPEGRIDYSVFEKRIVELLAEKK